MNINDLRRDLLQKAQQANLPTFSRKNLSAIQENLKQNVVGQLLSEGGSEYNMAWRQEAAQRINKQRAEAGLEPLTIPEHETKYPYTDPNDRELSPGQRARLSNTGTNSFSIGGGPPIPENEAGNQAIRDRMRQIAKGGGLIEKGIANTQQTPEYYELKAELDRRMGRTSIPTAQEQPAVKFGDSKTDPDIQRGQFPIYPEAVKTQATSAKAPTEQMGPKGAPSAVATYKEVKAAQKIADKTGMPTALPTNVAPGTMFMTDMDGRPVAVSPTQKQTKKISPAEFKTQSMINTPAIEREVEGLPDDYITSPSGYVQSPMEWGKKYQPSVVSRYVDPFKGTATQTSKTTPVTSYVNAPASYTELPSVNAPLSFEPSTPLTQAMRNLMRDTPTATSASASKPQKGQADFMKDVNDLIAAGKKEYFSPEKNDMSLTDTINAVISAGRLAYGQPPASANNRVIGGADPDIQRGQFVTPEDEASPYKAVGDKLYTKNPKTGKFELSHTKDSSTGVWRPVAKAK